MIEIERKETNVNEIAVQIWELITMAKKELKDVEFIKLLKILVGEMINCVNGMLN